jgi:GAF domain-containing protein
MEHVIQTISHRSDKIKILANVLPQILAIGQVELGALLVIGDEMNSLNVVVRRGMPNEIIKQLTKGKLGQTLLQREQLFIQPQALPAGAEQNLLKQYKLNYLLGLPLLFDGQLLGAMVVGTRHSSSLLSRPSTQQQLVILGHLVALFLDNLRLRTSRSRPPEEPSTTATPAPSQNANTAMVDDLENLLAAVMSAEEEVASQNSDLGLLNTLSKEVGSTFRLDRILEIAIESTRTTLSAETGWCYLFENGILLMQGHQGLSEKYVQGMQQLRPCDGVEGMAFTRREPILRDGLLFHSGRARTLFKEEGLQTVAAVPLRSQEEVIGVLAVASRRSRTWSLRDKRMLVSISQQVTQAIANSRMFAAVKEKSQTWEASYSALQQANSELVQRAGALERQLLELRRAEQQLWKALAASQESRRASSDASANEQLAITLKKILATINEVEEDFLSPTNAQVGRVKRHETDPL